MTGKVLFAGTAAVCSTFVLLAPSQNYTESSELGQKLTQYFGEKAWMVLYVSGAMEIGGHNFFLHRKPYNNLLIMWPDKIMSL
ncbi:MAG: hypothetical protein HWD59_03850 [Coxiellaceae bacterium]|nr:MAG: hypothetical protein HWD59_03850 [Coxiellaceae bacterium]